MSEIALINARILTIAGESAPRRGDALRDLGLIERGWIRTQHELIAEIGQGARDADSFDDHVEVIDVDGAVVMPSFVDCHTHACWAGERFEEFEHRLAGASYLEILESGGGIMSTVRATRNADQDTLTRLTLQRIGRMMSLGTGAIEIKSGYGLTPDDELKMLRAIRAAQGRTQAQVVSTFLGAHAIDRDNPNFVNETITETLPAVVEEFPGITCDAYCEEGAWTLDQCRRLFEAAHALGCPIRVHSDQFNSLGMTRLAVEMGARSVDHLEAVNPKELQPLCQSDTIAVLLPCTGFHLDDRYAPGRSIADSGGTVAIASNYNPGSSPTPSMPFTIALACRKLQLRPDEAIVAATYNAACVLGLEPELGSLEEGKRASIQVLDCNDERDLAYEFATPGPRALIIDGEWVFRRDAISL